MYARELAVCLKSLARKFPAVAVMGPRQSGKTTLAQAAFPDKPYVLLESPDTRDFAERDPRGFLARYPDGAVFDEIQRVPGLFSYLQEILDARKKNGLFILTGSHNFLLMEQITQSLAGRVALLTLLPFSWSELKAGGSDFGSYEEHLLAGGYPRVFSGPLAPSDFYPNYVRTYVERDVRLLKNVHDLSAFHTFLKMCACRVGQLLSLSSLADECGITHNTAKAWISLLEASYVVFLLRPYHRNWNKRLVKMPKLYFYDTGLAAYLAGIKNHAMLQEHSFKGALFECFLVSEVVKSFLNHGLEAPVYFWRDKLGREIDCVVEDGRRMVPIEMKAGRTVNGDFFKNTAYWCGLSEMPEKDALVVYGGDDAQDRKTGHVMGWKSFLSFVNQGKVWSLQ